MPKAVGYEHKRYDLTDAEWTEILVPFDCDYMKITVDADVKWRSDADDADTEIEIIASGWEAISSTVTSHTTMPRFPIGRVAAYLQSVDPTASVVVTFVR